MDDIKESIIGSYVAIFDDMDIQECVICPGP